MTPVWHRRMRPGTAALHNLDCWRMAMHAVVCWVNMHLGTHMVSKAGMHMHNE